MAMAPQGQAEHEHEHDHQHGLRSQPNSSHNLWEPYSSAGDYARTMALILAAFLTAMALGLALDLATSYLLGRIRRARRGRAGSGSGEAPPPPPPALVYSSTSTNLAGAAVECAICLTEFADGDAIRFMPACRHGFHARCIDRWLAGGRHSSCPTCRAPTAVATGAAAATQPDEAAASAS